MLQLLIHRGSSASLWHIYIDKLQGCFKAHMLFRAGELDYTAVADLSLLKANPGPHCIPVCSTRTALRSSPLMPLHPPACCLPLLLLSSSLNITTSQQLFFSSSLCRLASSSHTATLEGCFNCKTITKPGEPSCILVQTRNSLPPAGCDTPVAEP